MRAVLALSWLAVAATPAAPQPPPVEDFFRRPAYAQVTLSPDGERVAAVVPRRGRGNLAIIDIDRKVAKLITDFDVADVLAYHWIGNDRLLLALGDAQFASAVARFRGWYAVNVDGSELRAISDIPGIRARTIRKAVRGFDFIARDPQGGDEILIEARERSEKFPDVYRYNSRTGNMMLLSVDAPAGVVRWWVDRAGVPRLAASLDKGMVTLWHRHDAQAAWAMLEQGAEHELKIRPIAFDYDGTLYVAARAEGDRMAIYSYDPEARRVGQRIARHPDVDMSALMFNRAKRALVGIPYDADKPGIAWLDEDLARMQMAIDQALPQKINRLRVAADNPKRAIVASFSDRHPVRYYAYDADRRTLKEIDVSLPSIRPEAMAERKFVRYKARDGLEIPAYLTLPKDSAGKHLPLVVDIHGGPWVAKQQWGFNPLAQFFASRGYAVLQPDFRGTLGYGKRHFVSSFGQWGLAMQDDIADGVEWLIQQGTVERGRACLYGASYGGYATLWGLIKTPELYRCGVAALAVTDIGLMFEITWSDMARSPYGWLEHGARQRIGDPERDRDKFRSVSPLHHAERLAAPVLLAFGGADERVPIQHGTAFRAALDRHGKKYAWVVYDDEGHGFVREENRIDYYRRVDAFLQQHLQ